MNCTLIADSGSTKTDWILVSSENGILEIQTTGINPVRDSQDAILHVLANELQPQIPAAHLVEEIHFYGAGCVAPFSQLVTDALRQTFPKAQTSVESDLLGAARALCGHHEGIACILGTGSNSCLYDGQGIAHNVSPLGFILGDEGSGSVLGRTLVGNLLKNVFGQELKEEFLDEYQLTLPLIINKVYREAQPNRFLASLVPFIAKHRNHPGMHDMLVTAFRQFLQRNVANYGRQDLPVNFVGSIASVFRSELMEAMEKENMKMGIILQKPAREIAIFHTNQGK